MRRTLPLFALIALASAAEADVPMAFPADAAQTAAASYAIYNPGGSDFAKGRAALLAGDYARAVRLLEPLADGDFNPATKLLAGYANLGAGRIERAELYFARTLASDSRNPFGRHGLGLVALTKGDRPAAVAQLELLQRANRRCDSTCARAGEIASALSSLQRAIG